MVAAAGATAEQADQVLKLAELSGTNDDVLSQLGTLVAGNAQGEEGVERLRQILRGAKAGGVPDGCACSSMSRSPAASTITPARSSKRSSATCPTIGSVCSGGRYDNLAGLFTKQELPGIGASLGLDRLLAALEELGMHRKGPHARPGVDRLFRQGAARRLSATRRQRSGRPASASKSFPSPKSSASSSNTPTAAAFASPSSPANASSTPAPARSKTSPAKPPPKSRLRTFRLLSPKSWRAKGVGKGFRTVEVALR